MVFWQASAAVWLLTCFCCIATGYVVIATLAIPRASSRRKRRGTASAKAPLSGVSVLKPLCGAEPRLYDNLATFCEQTHPRFQLLFGVGSPDDPAIAVVKRLQAAYPDRDMTLVVDSTIHGQNLKVSNLINLMVQARHDLIVIADSDIAVEPGYLEAVTAPLADSGVGVVTCLYRAHGVGAFWPRVGALFVNQWFAPSVYLAHMFGARNFGFGATLALRRETLNRIGGLEALKDQLADDFWLAEYTRRLGLRTELSDIVVATDVIEPNLAALWTRETRWLRTIRSLSPAGYAFLFITFTSPWLLAGALLWQNAASSSLPAILLGWSTAIGLAARILLHKRTSRNWREFWRDLPLAPLRDALLALQWLTSFFGSHVRWRGARVSLAKPAAAVETIGGSR